MTTPGGVPNLPQGALTLDNLASNTQDMSTAAMKTRAAERFPSTFDSSTGLDPASDITPFGIINQLWAGFNSFVAAADPADIDGPEDLPGLLIDFIESLPVVGELANLLEAILGTYGGDDGTLLAVQNIFAPIRQLLQVITGVVGRFPTLAEIEAAVTSGLATFDNVINGITGGLLSGSTLTDMQDTLKNIPHINIQGLLGAGDVGAAIQNFVTGAAQTLQNDATLAEQSISQFQNYLSGALGFLGWNPNGATPPSSVAAITSSNNQSLNDRAVQKDAFANIDRTVDASFPLSDIITATTLPTIAITEANPYSAPINIRDGGQKQSIRFKGYVSSGTLYGFYVNLYHVDPTTGNWTWFYSTSNYAGSLSAGSAPQWNSINLSSADFIDTAQGDLIQAEIVVVGPGTFTMIGKTLSTQFLPMPGVFPPLPAAMRQQRVAAPTLDAIGTAISSTGTPSTSGSSTITVGSQATAGYLILVWAQNTGTIPTPPTWGGSPMTLVVNNQWATSGSVIGWIFLVYEITAASLGLQYLPSGSKTVSYSLSNFASHQTYVAGNVISLNNCAGHGTVSAVNSTTGTTLTQTITDPGVNNIALQIGSSENNNSDTTAWTINSVARTILWHTAGAAGVGYGGFFGLTPTGGSGNMTSAATFSPSGTWAMLNIPLLGVYQPAPATVANPGNPGSTTGVAQYSRTQPWIGLAGMAGETSYSPVIRTFNTTGSGQSFNPTAVFPWANYFDVIVYGAGGAGKDGTAFDGGGPGNRGSSTWATLTKAQAGSSNWTLNIGAGAAAGTRGAGQDSSVVVPGYGTLTGTGGAVAPSPGTGGAGTSGGAVGTRALDTVVTDHYSNTQPYVGGAGGSGGQGTGGQPGGSGGGGNATWMYSYIYGGAGGAGQVIIRAYQ